jgi:hypothetical protein
MPAISDYDGRDFVFGMLAVIEGLEIAMIARQDDQPFVVIPSNAIASAIGPRWPITSVYQ